MNEIYTISRIYYVLKPTDFDKKNGQVNGTVCECQIPFISCLIQETKRLIEYNIVL